MLRLAICFIPIIAEGLDVNPFLNGGVAVAVLAFILMKLEPRLRSIENAIDRMSRALLLVVISKDGPSTAEREQAQIILGELGKSKEKRDES